MREPHDITLRIGYGDRAREFRIGRNASSQGSRVCAPVLRPYAFYNYRENLSNLRDLRPSGSG